LFLMKKPIFWAAAPVQACQHPIGYSAKKDCRFGSLLSDSFLQGGRPSMKIDPDRRPSL